MISASVRPSLSTATIEGALTRSTREQPEDDLKQADEPLVYAGRLIAERPAESGDEQNETSCCDEPGRDPHTGPADPDDRQGDRSEPECRIRGPSRRGRVPEDPWGHDEPGPKEPGEGEERRAHREASQRLRQSAGGPACDLPALG